MAKGIFIPDITVEMIRKASLEAIETLLVEGKMYDVDMPKWIPCSERMPETGTSVLMASRQGWVAEGEYKGILDGCHLWTEYMWRASLTNGEIIAWMPLPKPYEGADDDRI